MKQVLVMVSALVWCVAAQDGTTTAPPSSPATPPPVSLREGKSLQLTGGFFYIIKFGSYFVSKLQKFLITGP